MGYVVRVIGLFESLREGSITDVSLPWRIAAELSILVTGYYFLKVYTVCVL
mgnify:CR=1 FL=1